MMRKINTSDVQNASEMVIITNNEEMYSNVASEGLYNIKNSNTAQEGLYWNITNNR